ncbi:MAG TPA: PaaI family thioesterase [Novosphingobium sp.]|nr:PaaI family thioesterase [Novosphingobium sp.]
MSHEPHDKLQSAADVPGTSRLVEMTAGEWAGWYHWEPVDDFEEHTGPFYCKPDGDALVCGFRPEAKNRNGGGNVHGGALMTFADYALFMTASGMDGSVHGVTLTMNCEFVGPAETGRLLTARGEIVRQGFSIVFVRGIIDDEGRPVLTFSGTIKRLTPREKR